MSQRFFAVVARERGLEREQFVERNAKGIDVGAVIDRDPLGESLFRAHVAQRADEVSGHRHAGVAGVAGKAEVGDPELTALVEHQVRWLDVAVHNAHLVCMIKRFSGLDANLRNTTITLLGGNSVHRTERRLQNRRGILRIRKSELGTRKWESGRCIQVLGAAF